MILILLHNWLFSFLVSFNDGFVLQIIFTEYFLIKKGTKKSENYKKTFMISVISLTAFLLVLFV